MQAVILFLPMATVPIRPMDGSEADLTGIYNLLQVYKMNQEAEKRNLKNYQALAKFFRAWQFTQLTHDFRRYPIQ